MKRKTPSNLVVFLPNWVGDAAMATPALRTLRRWADGQAVRLIGVMRPVIADVLEGSRFLHESLPYDKSSADGPLGTRELMRKLKERAPCDALLLTNSLRTAWLAWRAGCRRRIGYAQEGRRILLTDPLVRARWNRRRLPRSAVDDYLDLARVLGAFPDSHGLELDLTPTARQQAASLWKEWRWLDEQVIAFHPGAAYGVAKCWPASHFAELAVSLLANRADRRILVLCGPNELETASKIVELAEDVRVQSAAAYQPSISLTMGCLARSSLLVTGDSGPRHLAAALDTPTVTLFGPTDPCWSHNYHRQDRWIQLELDCRPCAKRTCPLGHHRCMNDLAPHDVAAAVEVSLTDYCGTPDQNSPHQSSLPLAS